jgi:hypothetical protein
MSDTNTIAFSCRILGRFSIVNNPAVLAPVLLLQVSADIGLEARLPRKYVRGMTITPPENHEIRTRS